MTPTETKRVTEALDMNAIRKGIADTDYDIDNEVSREEFKDWVESLDDERSDFIQQLRSSAKIAKLGQWEGKMSEVEETRSDDLDVNADAILLRGAHYYDSFFQYTNHTTWIFKIQGYNGALEEIHEEAESAAEAQDILREYCGDLSEPVYENAVEEVPAPLIGRVDGSESPRLFHFEDQDHLYVEYWTEGSKDSIFDVTTGDYKTAQSLQRTCFRIHLESGLVEIAGDNSKGPNKKALQAFLERFNGNALISNVRIGVDGIQNAKENLAVIVSLDEFIGDDAKIRFARNKSGNVEADPYHSETESDRERLRMNMQLLYGRTPDGWELIYPNEIARRYADDEEVEVGEIVSELEDSTFEEVLPLTVGLNREKNSIRFRTTDISPSTRRSVFHLFADELNWN